MNGQLKTTQTSESFIADIAKEAGVKPLTRSKDDYWKLCFIIMERFHGGFMTDLMAKAMTYTGVDDD